MCLIPKRPIDILGNIWPAKTFFKVLLRKMFPRLYCRCYEQVDFDLNDHNDYNRFSTRFKGMFYLLYIFWLV